MERMEGRAEGKSESIGIIRSKFNQKYPYESNEKIADAYLKEEQAKFSIIK